MAGRFQLEGVFRLVDRMTGPVRRIGRRFDRFAARTQRTFRDLRTTARQFRGSVLAIGAAFTATAAAAAYALRDVAQVGMEFDSAISGAGAVFEEPARRGSEAFQTLEDAARRTGRQTEFSATQSAEALQTLAQAGLSAEQAAAALPGVVDLATNAHVDLATASRSATGALNAFGLMSDDSAQLTTNLARANDVMARAASSADMSVTDLTEGMSAGGTALAATGTSIEDFSALMIPLAQNNMRGAEAGRALTGVLARISAPTGAARSALRRLGVDAADADGNLRPMADIMGDLGGAMGDLGTAERARTMITVFGRRNQIAANILMNAGTETINEHAEALRDAGGASERMASAIRDTAAGDMRQFESMVTDLKLEVWDLVRGPFRSVVQGMSEWLTANRAMLASGFQRVVRGIGAAFSWVSDNMEDIVKWSRRIAIAIGIVLAIGTAVSAVLLAAVLVIPAILTAIVVGLVAIGEFLWEFFEPIADRVVEVVGGIWEGVKAAFTRVRNFITGVFVMLSPFFEAYIGPWVATARGVLTRIQDFFAPFVALIGKWFANLSISAGAIWDFFATSALSAIQVVIGFLAGPFANVLGPIADLLGTAFEGIGDFAGDIEQAGAAYNAEHDGGGGGGPSPQVVSPQARTATEVSERTETTRAEVTVRAEPGTSAAVTRQPRRGSGVSVTRSGAD